MTDSLDPTDWDAFRAEAHRLLDSSLDRLEDARNRPWQPVPQEVRAGYRLGDDEPGQTTAEIVDALQDRMMPYATGNTHPRFFGWVHGTGMAEGILSEMVAATMNANCGGRDHGMVYVEREVIDWTRRQMGFPEDTSGVLVTGTSQATVIALQAARVRALTHVRTTGQADDLNALADIAGDQGLWLHIDAAFGAWTRLAAAPYRQLTDGIGRADSMACDFHKWMAVPYDCGIVLIRNEAEHSAAFAARPAYLTGMDSGLAGGDPWFCDYGVDLSRGNRALKVWTAIKAHGTAKLGRTVTANCERAAQMGALVTAAPQMQLAAPVVSNLCVFTADTRLSPDAQSRLNMRISQDLQNAGVAVFSTTLAEIGGASVTCLRAAITNHRTTPEDVEIAIAAVARAAGHA
ncbi:MAG: amino acid decarboxylase [Loktanella sp.]|nr:amino acid decarboxylase [Loktanella sp.]